MNGGTLASKGERFYVDRKVVKNSREVRSLELSYFILTLADRSLDCKSCPWDAATCSMFTNILQYTERLQSKERSHSDRSPFCCWKSPCRFHFSHRGEFFLHFFLNSMSGSLLFEGTANEFMFGCFTSAGNFIFNAS